MQAHGFPDKNIPATDGCKMNESCFVCRNCGGGDGRTFIDLGMSPLANAYVSRENADIADTFYPLHARVCVRCFLLQVCLLYTSPSPRDLSTSRMPSSA